MSAQEQVSAEEKVMSNKKLKCYEVTVRATAMVFVQDAESEEQAYEFARDAFDTTDFGDTEMQARELTTEDEIDVTRRHADARSCP